MQTNVKWDLGLKHYFDNKVLVKNNRLIVFSIVFKISKIANYRENNKSIVLKQYFFLKYSSKAVH